MKHILHKGAVAFTFLVYVGSLVATFFISIDTFRNSTLSSLNDKYNQEIAPAGFVFNVIWPVIYLWNFLAITYLLVTAFLSPEKSPVNFKPTLVPYKFLVGFIALFSACVVWLFVFRTQILWLSFLVLFISAASAYFAVGVSCRRVENEISILDTKDTVVMLRLYRIFVQNGLSMIATWLTLATSIGLTTLILYEDSADSEIGKLRGMSTEDGSTIILSLLFLLIVIWFVLDNFVWERYFRYIFTIFPVLILAFTGIVVKHCSLGIKRNMIIAAVELSFCVIAFIIKIALFFYRRKLRQNQPKTDESKLPL